MKIADILHGSIVDGPGIRSVVFFQGCIHHCRGCHNSGTWDVNKGTELSVAELLTELNSNAIVGRAVTLSGGDPFLQVVELFNFVTALKHNNYHICVYTGYLWEHIISVPLMCKCLPYIDLLIDGPFIVEQKSLDLRFRGSRNQRIIDVQASLSTGQLILSPLND